MIQRRRRLLLLCLIAILVLGAYRISVISDRKPTLSLPFPPSGTYIPDPVIPNPIVLIDPGHGGGDGGAVGAGIAEKDITLSIALRLREILESVGQVDVAMTRDTDIHVSATDRIRVANEVMPDLIVSIHANSFRLTYVRGVETYYRATCEESREIATLLHEAVLESYMTAGHARLDRDIRPGTFRILTLPETRHTILLEIGYISNREDRAILVDPKFQAVLAEKLAEAIAKLLNRD